MKTIYLVRHCQAVGQPHESPLTEIGFYQARQLANFFKEVGIERIISSPYMRAIQTVRPLAKQKNIEIEINYQLKERVLSNEPLLDWFKTLRKTFYYPEFKLAGGESSQEAANRIVEVVERAFKSNSNPTVIVTHGNLMALLLNHYHKEFGFNEWAGLSNPDVYRLILNRNNDVTFERVEHELI